MSLVAPEKLGDVIAALYHAFFVDLKPISKPEDFLPIVETVLGKEMAGQALATVRYWFSLLHAKIESLC